MESKGFARLDFLDWQRGLASGNGVSCCFISLYLLDRKLTGDSAQPVKGMSKNGIPLCG